MKIMSSSSQNYNIWFYRRQKGLEWYQGEYIFFGWTIPLRMYMETIFETALRKKFCSLSIYSHCSLGEMIEILKRSNWLFSILTGGNSLWHISYTHIHIFSMPNHELCRQRDPSAHRPVENTLWHGTTAHYKNSKTHSATTFSPLTTMPHYTEILRTKRRIKGEKVHSSICDLYEYYSLKLINPYDFPIQ